MGLYPGSINGSPATIYGPLPTHGFTEVALVLHTTETRGMPGFNGGDTAPHYVYDPSARVWHMLAEYEDGYVGTLKGHSSGHGNCKAFQVEILGYSDPAHDPWVGDFTEENYADLSAFVAWARDRYGIGEFVTPTPEGGWRYGTDSIYRLTDDEWEGFSGLTAHGAVPHNTHWDTGVLDLVAISGGGSGPPPPPPSTPGGNVYLPLERTDGFNSNPERREDVKWLQRALDRAGLFDSSHGFDGKYGDDVAAGVSQLAGGSNGDEYLAESHDDLLKRAYAGSGSAPGEHSHTVQLTGTTDPA